MTFWEVYVSFDSIEYVASAASAATHDIKPLKLDEASANKLAELLTDALGEPDWKVRQMKGD